jgi:hypothetical protein
MVEAQRDQEVNEEAPSFLTTTEACDLFRYSSPASFRRAWRREGLPLYPQIGSRRWLVAASDVARFLGSPVVDR